MSKIIQDIMWRVEAVFYRIVGHDKFSKWESVASFFERWH